MLQADRPIITLKQAEAFYWTATLRSLVQAAERLHLAQSTLSKRVAELEATVSARLFDRSSRAMDLTRVGQRLLPIAADLLAAEARFRESALGPRTFSGPFRLGVTELVALTWLPKLIAAIAEFYPAVVPEPEVDASRLLFERLADGRVDFVVGLDPPVTADFRAVPLGHVTLQWASAPGAGPAGETVPLAELANFPILTQGEDSGLQRLSFEWFQASGVRFNRIVRCNSHHVLMALTAAGLGVSFLVEHLMRPEVSAGRLRTFRTVPAIPAFQYFAVSRVGTPDAFTERVTRLVQECCDFV